MGIVPTLGTKVVFEKLSVILKLFLSCICSPWVSCGVPVKGCRGETLAGADSIGGDILCGGVSDVQSLGAGAEWRRVDDLVA